MFENSTNPWPFISLSYTLGLGLILGFVLMCVVQRVRLRLLMKEISEVK